MAITAERHVATIAEQRTRASDATANRHPRTGVSTSRVAVAQRASTRADARRRLTPFSEFHRTHT